MLNIVGVRPRMIAEEVKVPSVSRVKQIPHLSAKLDIYGLIAHKTVITPSKKKLIISG